MENGGTKDTFKPHQNKDFFLQYLFCRYVTYVTLQFLLTYLPHKAVAEVSKDKEPIGRECAKFNWFESQLMSDSNELRVK